MGRGKSRHYRDESDPLLGFYSQTIRDSTTSHSNTSNPLYSSVRAVSPPVNDDSCRVDGYYGGDGGDVTNKSPLSPLKSTFDASVRAFSFHNSHRRGGDGSSSISNRSLNSRGELKKPKRKKNGYRVHRVSYTAQNHVQVLFQMYGSAFPNVLPFVMLNMAWTCGVEYLKRSNIMDLTFHSSVGHSFMGLLVSFLIVSRSKISYDRFMEFRRHLATTYRTCREIAQSTSVFTFQTQTLAAQEWRQQVCFQTILLLRVTMDALLWSSTERGQWEDEYFSLQDIMEDELNNAAAVADDDENVDEFEDDDEDEETTGNHEEDDTENNHDNDIDDDDEEAVAQSPPPREKRKKRSHNRKTKAAAAVSEHFFRFRKLSHGRRSRIDENFRAPITMGHVLKQTIMVHPHYLGYKMAVNEYRDLVNFVTIFLEAFHGFRVLIFTPYPFPLVQMTRAFLFFWVYTLPLVLLKDYRLWSSILIVCLVSFGFIGIEYVSMALDDPFGDDTNDVDEHGMALLVYEDIYLAIYRTDGPAAAFALRERVLARYKQGRDLDCYRDDLKGYAIWESPHVQAQRQAQQQQQQAQHQQAQHQQQVLQQRHVSSRSTKSKASSKRSTPPPSPPLPTPKQPQQHPSPPLEARHHEEKTNKGSPLPPRHKKQ